MLSTGLIVQGMVEGSPMWEDGQVKIGDVLVSVGGQVVTGRSLFETSEIIQR